MTAAEKSTLRALPLRRTAGNHLRFAVMPPPKLAPHITPSAALRCRPVARVVRPTAVHHAALLRMRDTLPFRGALRSPPAAAHVLWRVPTLTPSLSSRPMPLSVGAARVWPQQSAAETNARSSHTPQCSSAGSEAIDSKVKTDGGQGAPVHSCRCEETPLTALGRLCRSKRRTCSQLQV